MKLLVGHRPVLQPLIDTPFHGGPSTWTEDLEIIASRHGYPEEAHFTVAYSAVPDESAPRGIGGVLATVHETTGKVIPVLLHLTPLKSL